MKKNTVNISSRQPRRRRAPVIEAEQWLRALDREEYPLTDRQFNVLQMLAGHVNDDGQCWLKHQRLAAEINILPQRLADVKVKDASPEDAKRIESAVTSISRAVRALERWGLITIEQTTNLRGGSGNKYTVHVPALIGANDEAPLDAGVNSGPDPSINPDLTVASSGLDPSVKSSIKSHKKTHKKKAAEPQPSTASGSQDQDHQGVSSPGELKDLWADLLHRHYKGALFLPGGKEMGQLKDLATFIGSSTRLVMEYVLPNWAEFTEMAKTDEAAFPIPAQPTVGFMLSYRSTALKLYDEKVKKQATILRFLAEQQGFDMGLYLEYQREALSQLQGCSTLDEVEAENRVFYGEGLGVWGHWCLARDLRNEDADLHAHLMLLPSDERKRVLIDVSQLELDAWMKHETFNVVDAFKTVLPGKKSAA